MNLKVRKNFHDNHVGPVRANKHNSDSRKNPQTHEMNLLIRT